MERLVGPTSREPGPIAATTSATRDGGPDTRRDHTSPVAKSIPASHDPAACTSAATIRSVPRAAGGRVKTDRRDAQWLLGQWRAGALVRVPSLPLTPALWARWRSPPTAAPSPPAATRVLAKR